MLREAKGFGNGFVWRAIFGRELEVLEAVKIVDGAAVQALGLGVETQKGGDEFGLAIDAIEAVGEAEGAVPMDGGPEALGELGAWRMLASSGVNMATLRQLLQRPALMAARR